MPHSWYQQNVGLRGVKPSKGSHRNSYALTSSHLSSFSQTEIWDIPAWGFREARKVTTDVEAAEITSHTQRS
jgi:hypothetical protein